MPARNPPTALAALDRDGADLTVVDVAGILGVSTRTVERLKASGAIGFVKVGGRQTRFTRSQVAAYIETLRVEHQPQGA